jgi:hypothetical protein
LKGVIPDIVLPSVANESKDIGESALENPLVCDKIDPAQYDRLNLVAPYLPDLLKRCAQRIATEREFDYVREDIELFKQRQADKTISLNEAKQLKEKEEADARQKARDKERLARNDPQEKIFELTVKQASLPAGQLPPPVEKTNFTLAKLSSGPGAASAAVSTNSASAAVTKDAASPGNLEENADEEKAPVVDGTLIEAEHILLDYFALLAKDKVLTAGH